MAFKDISNKAIRELGAAYMSGAVPVLAANAGSAATIKTTQSPAASLATVINGVPKLKANLSAQALTVLAALQQPVNGNTGFIRQPAGTTAYYLVVVNGAGSVYTIQGNWASYVASNPFKTDGNVLIPEIYVPELYAPLGCIKLVNATYTTSGGWLPGTTNLDASGVTATYCDLHRLPDALPTFA